MIIATGWLGGTSPDRCTVPAPKGNYGNRVSAEHSNHSQAINIKKVFACWFGRFIYALFGNLLSINTYVKTSKTE
jgi:hypothetical protein